MMDSMDASEADQLKIGTLSDIWGRILPKVPLNDVHAAAESKSCHKNKHETENRSSVR